MPFQTGQTSFTLLTLLQELSQPLLALGWILVLFMALWIAWQVYTLLKSIDFVSSIQWTYLQVTLPDTAEETPASMEHAYNIWGGIHKNPDLTERYFEGYMYAWYSCELHCQANKARYIIVVPHVHRKFFEGVIYGQYPSAELKEVADYTQRFSWQDIGHKFDMYGTEMILTNDDIYPIKTYKEYEDSLAPEERFIDPHQALVEAYTNVSEGEEFWVQFLIRPVDHLVGDWSKKGEKEIAKISGQAKEDPPGMMKKVTDSFVKLPGELFHAFTTGPVEAEDAKDEKPQLKFFNPTDEAKMKGILQKISKGAFRTKIRLLYLAPKGQMSKPAIGKAIGAFKQFNTSHLNGLKPDPFMKTNGPNYIAKKSRRAIREKKIFLLYQWRDFWGNDSGMMMGPEELATLYHLPAKYMRAPSVERAKAGLKGAPENLPFA